MLTGSGTGTGVNKVLAAKLIWAPGSRVTVSCSLIEKGPVRDVINPVWSFENDPAEAILGALIPELRSLVPTGQMVVRLFPPIQL
jgi:hypothetical protein